MSSVSYNYTDKDGKWKIRHAYSRAADAVGCSLCRDIKPNFMVKVAGVSCNGEMEGVEAEHHFQATFCPNCGADLRLYRDLERLEEVMKVCENEAKVVIADGGNPLEWAERAAAVYWALGFICEALEQRANNGREG